MENARLIKANFAQLASFVEEAPEESHTLEFKRKSVPDVLELQKEDRRNLGAAISGFANATGGTLILGVATEKHQGIDRAKGLDLIANVSAVAGRVRSYISECVSPVVEGIKVRAVADDSGSGLIMVSVPRGQARPHMSTAPDHHTYYRRVVDSFVPMEPYEVEEMMRLKTEPHLRFVYSIVQAGSVGSNKRFGILFGLENTSNVTAKFPYISYRQDANRPRVAEYGLDGNGNNLWQKLNDVAGHGVIFAAGADRVLHPGQKLFISKLDYDEEFDARFGRWGVSQLQQNEVLTLEFQYGCEDSPIETTHVTLTRDQLLAIT